MRSTDVVREKGKSGVIGWTLKVTEDLEGAHAWWAFGTWFPYPHNCSLRIL
jgi:hypothetical protein